MSLIKKNKARFIRSVPYYSAEQQNQRYKKIAKDELRRKQQLKLVNRRFIEKCESNEHMILAVTPDKNVESINGTLNFDFMTDVNFSNRLPKHLQIKKQESCIPYVGQYEDIKTAVKFLGKLNEDEVKCVE